MKYEKIIDAEKIEQCLKQGDFLAAIQMIVSEMKHNYMKAPEQPCLATIYNSVAYLGKEKTRTDRQSFEYVSLAREEFIERLR